MPSDIGYSDDGFWEGQAGDGAGQGLQPQTAEFRYGRDGPAAPPARWGPWRGLPGKIEDYVAPLGAGADGVQDDSPAGADHVAAANAVGQILQPALASALAAPEGSLTHDGMIDRTADVLHQTLADGLVSPDHFADIAGQSLDFLSGLPDDDAGIRQSLMQLGADHAATLDRVNGAGGSAGGGGDADPFAGGWAVEDPELSDEGGQLIHEGSHGGGDDQDGPEPGDEDDGTDEDDEDDEGDGQPGAAPPPNAARTAGPRPAQPPARQPATSNADGDFGELSRLGESGSRAGDPAKVSSGKGDLGGVSYGVNQIKSKGGQMAAFLTNEGKPWAARLKGMKPGSPEFTRAWRQIAAENPKGFGAAQKAFADRLYFGPQAHMIQHATGVDLAGHSRALKNAIYSTAIQHGAHTGLVVKAMGAVKTPPGAPGYDAALINAIYAERGRRKPDGTLAYFHKSSLKQQQGVAARFVRERQAALQMLQAKGG